MADDLADPALVDPDLSITHLDTQKERHSLTLDQRRELRRWAHSHTVRPSHKQCIEWFFAQYGLQISQSTVSHSLSTKYSRLDGENAQLSGSRLRFGNWPDVEKLVLLWYQQVQASGRQPTNEELGEKAKAIFHQLPRYRDEPAPEFSPGWIHRFKKRYGLLVRRQQRRYNEALSPADDVDYLAECAGRFITVQPDTSPAVIRESIMRALGIEASLGTCALVRDEILRRIANTHAATAIAALAVHAEPELPPPASPAPEQPMYNDDDPEVVLQNALRQLQQEEQAAEEQAAAVREERERAERGLHPQLVEASRADSAQAYDTPTHELPPELTLANIPEEAPIQEQDRPLRCPFCVNQRMLRSIKEAVEHMSTHVDV